jgi:Zn finger protein HypA/HybF involved in hydrogenase expression
VHESRTVGDLVTRAEREIDVASDRVRRLTVRIGVLSPIGAEPLRQGLERRTLEAWGYVPEVVVEASNDLARSDAAEVRLVSILVEG